MIRSVANLALLRDRAQRIASDRKSSDGDHHCANGPGGQAFERFERMVRDTAHSLGKKVVFEILGSDIEVDKSVVDEIGEPVRCISSQLARPRRGNAGRAQGFGEGSGREAHYLGGARAIIRGDRGSDDGRGIDMNRVLERALAAGLADADHDLLSDAEILALIAR